MDRRTSCSDVIQNSTNKFDKWFGYKKFVFILLRVNAAENLNCPTNFVDSLSYHIQLSRYVDGFGH